MSEAFAIKVTELSGAKHVGTRNRLVGSALELFALNGFDSVSTRQICKHVNTNLASITNIISAARRGSIRPWLSRLSLRCRSSSCLPRQVCCWGWRQPPAIRRS